MRRALILIAILLGALLLAGCEDSYSGTLIVSGTHNFSIGQTLDGELAIAGGEVRIERGARVTGSVYMLKGDLYVDGEVGGDISAIAGNLVVGPHAHVGGDLSVAGTPEIAPGARIDGRVTTGAKVPEAAASQVAAQSTQNRL
ncbi:MAG: polymer-forming cytoskeletal protein, partial [Dehalococcoidales bacterium]|nr:polymer-forming cytoskeletal protein [Dehalococcoidales bacterium]